MRRDLTTRPTQRNGGGHAQDKAKERQQSPLQKRTRPPPRRSDSDRASNRGTNARKSDRPRKGKDQAVREELSLTRSLMEGKQQVHRRRQENRQEEAEATPEGEVPQPKRQPADRRQIRVGEPGSGPTVRGAQWREPRIPENPQPQRGTPGNRAPAVAGRKNEPPTEAPNSAGRKEGRVRKTTPDP